MNYHIIIADKYFARYIEDIYELGKESENVFWVRGDKEDSELFNTIRPVEYLGTDEAYWVEKLRQVRPEDKLIVSWYTLNIGEAILKANVKSSLYVCLMGGDFYEEPAYWQAGWLYDKMTFNKLNDLNYFPTLFKRNAGTNTLMKRLKAPYHYFQWRIEPKELYKRKKKTIGRIDFLLVSEVEYHLLHKIYPSLRAKRLNGIWDQNFDAAVSMPIHESNSEELHIQIGNSADPANNHIDAFYFVKKKLKCNYYVHCFLSYAGNAFKDWIIEAGKQCFGDRFVPIVDFMQRNDYMEYVNAMDVFVMYHNRQQAYGNIATALVLGKPVFMKSSNVIYKRLKKIGVVPVYDVSTLGTVSMQDCIAEAKRMRNNTIDIFRKLHSKEVRLNNWMHIIG